MPSYIVANIAACYCAADCPACAGQPATPSHITRHNLRVACHGERSYRISNTPTVEAPDYVARSVRRRTR